MIFICMTSADEIKAKSEQIDDCLLKIAQKDKTALERLYKLTKTSVYAFAFSILKNSDDASDVLQDVYIKIFSSSDKYKTSGKPMAWILTITKNFCLLKLRERKKYDASPMEEVENYLIDNKELTSDDKMVLHTCLKALSDTERQIVILHAVTGLKHREIAKLLDMGLSTVLSKYNRSLKKLKLMLKEGD